MRSYVFLAFFLIGFIPLKGFAKGPSSKLNDSFFSYEGSRRERGF